MNSEPFGFAHQNDRMAEATEEGAREGTDRPSARQGFRSSSVWQYFTENNENGTVKCKLCSKVGY